MKRPGYSQEAIVECLRIAQVSPGMHACDIGAGTGNLTLPLLRAGLRVIALEPNDAMRLAGSERTKPAGEAVSWRAACAESTGLPSGTFELVAFGSSFNVVDSARALREAARILKTGGWFVCLWNYRDLQDPLQRRIENLISRSIPDYSYGARREDQTPVIQRSGLFERITLVEKEFVHRTSVQDCLSAWRSHATLRRQAGAKLSDILAGISTLMYEAGSSRIDVPYTTRLWMAQTRAYFPPSGRPRF